MNIFVCKWISCPNIHIVNIYDSCKLSEFLGSQYIMLKLSISIFSVLDYLGCRILQL